MDPKIKCYKSNLTLTDIKKIAKLFLTEQNINELSQKNERLIPLLNGIIRSFDECYKNNRIDLSKYNENGYIFPFDVPILLGAQILENQTGFGNEYFGNELVVEGTKYGETTKFLIVGFYAYREKFNNLIMS